MEKMLKELNLSDSIYILLSPDKANLIKGVSVPYIENEGKQQYILIFDSYDKAKEYIDNSEIEIIDGIYAVGKADNSTEFNSLKAIFSIAINLGIEGVKFNSLCEDAAKFEIKTFLETNDIKEAEEENVNEFNPVKIIDFTDTFAISPDRKKELNKLIFNGGETYGDYVNTFVGLTMLERCYLSDTCTRFMAQAISSGKKEDEQYFRKVEGLIQVAVWKTLPNEKNLYTLINPVSEVTVIEGDAMYVLYTDRFKYMGKYNQRKLKDFDELQRMIIRNDIRKLVVTDGPHHMTLVSRINMLGLE